MIFKFLWRNKKDRVKRSVLISSVDKGGLNVPDFETLINSAKLKWIKKIAYGNKSLPWKVILEMYLEKENVNLNTLLYSNFTMKTLLLSKKKSIRVL